jgi:hypothetical protein
MEITPKHARSPKNANVTKWKINIEWENDDILIS